MQLTEAVATVVKFDLELATPGSLDDADALAALESKLRETLSCFAGCALDVAVDGRQVVVAEDARVVRRRQDQGRLLQPAAPQPL